MMEVERWNLAEQLVAWRVGLKSCIRSWIGLWRLNRRWAKTESNVVSEEPVASARDLWSKRKGDLQDLQR